MQILELFEQAQSNSDWEASIKKLLENKGLKETLVLMIRILGEIELMLRN